MQVFHITMNINEWMDTQIALTVKQISIVYASFRI